MKQKLSKNDMDSLYHCLRLVSNSGDQEFKEIIYGLSRHLLVGGDYLALVKFLDFYGSTYLMDDILHQVSESHIQADRIVEIGAGTGWFGRRIAYVLDAGLMSVDKRRWGLIDMVLDLELDSDLDTLFRSLRPYDVIVMSDFLHCISNPRRIIYKLEKWPMIILEHNSTISEHAESYFVQIGRYGCICLTVENITDILGRRLHSVTRIAESHDLYITTGGP